MGCRSPRLAEIYFFFFSFEIWSGRTCKLVSLRVGFLASSDSYRKYEHSKTFGLIASASSNVVWSPDEDAPSSNLRATGAGRAFVDANEEVLCWDVKKGELLSRWKDSNCKAGVTVIARSKSDPDVFAVGCVKTQHSNSFRRTDTLA